MLRWIDFKLGRSTRVFDVVVRGFEGFGGFVFRIGVGLEQRDCVGEGHGFAVGGAGAGARNIFRFHACNIPLEAGEFDLN